nr:neurofilament heavy polypeptide-like [Cherax quadricarinatus]
MGSESFMNFWSSIVNDDCIQDQLKSVMTIEDREERALQLLSRTLFLLVMEIKHERDAVTKTLNQMKERSSRCTSQGENAVGDASGSVKPYELQHQKEMNQLDSQESPVKINIPIMQSEGDGYGIQKIVDASGKKESKLMNNQRRNNDYRCLSRSPRRVSPKNSREIEEKENGMTNGKASEEIASKILAPETLSLDENELYINVSKRRALATQTVSVPETLAVENTSALNTNVNENTDFYGNNVSSGSEILEETVTPPWNSPIDGGKEMRSPHKDQISTESLNQRSPVLGKQNRLSTSATMKETIDVPVISPLALNLDANKQSPKPLDSKGIKRTKIITSTPKYSSLSTQNFSSSLNDSTSPSLLPAVKNKAVRNNNEETHPSNPTSLENLQEQKQSSKSRKAFQRCLSSSRISPPIGNSRSLRRYKTTDEQSKISLSKIIIEPPTSNKKKYKQTKISSNIFQKKTDVAKATGGVQSKVFNPFDEAAAISAALEESLKTKAFDDMMRKKRDALLAESYAVKSAVGVSGHSNRKDNQELSPTSSSVSHEEACKKEVKVRKECPVKTFELCPMKLRSSPQKRKLESPECENESLTKAKRVLQQDRTKKQVENEILELDQLLDKINKSPLQENKVKKKLQRKCELQKPRSKVIDDSFDVVPIKNKVPEFAHRGDVVRKKADRKQLAGWQCHECEKWYEAHPDPQEKKV